MSDDGNAIVRRFIVWQARERGNWDYLAGYLDAEGVITPEIRTLLAHIVRGDLKKPKRRPDKDLVAAARLCMAVLELEERGWTRKMAVYDVARIYNTSQSTVKRALQNEPPPWWDEALAACSKAASTDAE